MIKLPNLIIFFLLISCALKAQTGTTSRISITDTYSPNGKYHIKCIPFDNEEPSMRGKSLVYGENGKLIYSIGRDFDRASTGNYLSISDDGKTIVYVIVADANENIDGLKSVSIYKKAKLVKSFTLQQITNCDPAAQRCVLNYRNYDKVVDVKIGNDNGIGRKKVFKIGVSDEEKFLCDHNIFNTKKTLYITDPAKIVHAIDLDTYEIRHSPFLDVYQQLKKTATSVDQSSHFLPAPYPTDKSFFPNLANGAATGVKLGEVVGMKAERIGQVQFNMYRYYHIRLKAYLSKDGKMELIDIDADKPLPKEKIVAFFNNNVFDASFIPAEVDKWYLNTFFWLFRNPSNEIAIQEKAALEKEKALERERRMTMDSINHVYIPADLDECFAQLDKTLPTVTKKEMLASDANMGMLSYHFGLGTWIRNNWGLHGGSRLLAYFQRRGMLGIYDAESISGVILSNYYNWLKGDKDAGKKFERDNPIKN